MISATKLVQIVAPAHSTGFGTFSGSLDSAKVFALSPTRLVTGASRAELQASSSWRHYHLTAETAGPRLHRELVLRLLREISPQESFFGLLARHDAVATSSPRAECAGRDEVPSCGPDPAIAARAANLRAVPPQKVGPVTVRGENPSYISESYKSYRVLV